MSTRLNEVDTWCTSNYSRSLDGGKICTAKAPIVPNTRKEAQAARPPLGIAVSAPAPAAPIVSGRNFQNLESLFLGGRIAFVKDLETL